MHCLAQTGLLGRISPFATLAAVHLSQANQPVSLTVAVIACAAPAVRTPASQSAAQCTTRVSLIVFLLAGCFPARLDDPCDRQLVPTRRNCAIGSITVLAQLLHRQRL